jgi:hypothetical protein
MPDIDEALSRFSRTWLKPGGTRGTRGTQNNFKEMAVPRSQDEGGTGGTQLFPIGKREKGGTAKGEHVNELANNELEGAVPPVPRVPPFFIVSPKFPLVDSAGWQSSQQKAGLTGRRLPTSSDWTISARSYGICELYNLVRLSADIVAHGRDRPDIARASATARG